MKKFTLLALTTSIFLAACSAPLQSNDTPVQTEKASKMRVQSARASERLGTKWGDEVNSSVTKVDFKRTSNKPISQNNLYYAHKEYRGRKVQSISLASGKISFSVVSDTRSLPLFRENSNYYLLGKSGGAYRLVYKNNSDQMFEIVASVDGLDVLNGKPASQINSGYVLAPNGKLVIEGFRKSQSAVASFVFSKPEQAYANHVKKPTTQNTGVIGTVIYELYDPKKIIKPKQLPTRNLPQAFPADSNNKYAQPPQ